MVASSGENLYNMLNSQIVQFNKLNKNVHGEKVFVIKCQLYRASDLSDRHDMMSLGMKPTDYQWNVQPTSITPMVYDIFRNESILLRTSENESGLRGEAHRRFVSMASQKGGISNGIFKVYLYAQRNGDILHVFTGKLPPQLQPF